ncbi:SRPBCC family protein [Streptomyces sp. NBC_00094]|uniref:SRPBCC family protein n=1 Tax=Streptomyces sp. NBC_00094 TaxID=2903620 RepID=UPI00224C98F0|nr:SRPBCC family protein [Streptomyces sp. NBC_00094]MCX5391662.1 SRPBCC domain-containing protein [Streptomyces sp. NBC_00094]
MEHEVFVPVPAEVLRATLTDPARVVRCVPGLQRDADAEAGPLAGRLKVRVGGHTITYRGTLRVVERDGAITYEGQGAEARGKGSAELSLTVVLTPVDEGTSLSFTGALTAEGRLAEATDEARNTAGARLLDKFVEAVAALAEEPGDAAEEDGADSGTGGESGTRGDSRAGRDSRADADPRTPADAGSDVGPETDHDGVDDGVEEPGRSSGFGVEIPPPSLDPLLDEEFGVTPVELPSPQPAAEAAHARRTMIGRSAEEVDHAPPRGRYAPVPAPESTRASDTLRWIAPAAVLALASAVVVGRALRRRR